MAMTNAERQKRYRAEKRKSGLRRKDVWTDGAGLISTTKNNGTWGGMKPKDFCKEINKMFPAGEYKDWEIEAVYAELFEYAKLAEGTLKRTLGR